MLKQYVIGNYFSKEMYILLQHMYNTFCKRPVPFGHLYTGGFILAKNDVTNFKRKEKIVGLWITKSPYSYPAISFQNRNAEYFLSGKAHE